MLGAYFDDSGTHQDANVVLVAGVFGTEWQLRSLDQLWQRNISNPLCGRKPPVRRFHAFDCDNSMGEFAGWKRVQTDYFCHQLRNTIICSPLTGLQFRVATGTKLYAEI
jgi:hypothetical protein